MATKLNSSFASLETEQVIGDKLNKPEFFTRDSEGNYASYTGFTLSSVLVDRFNEIVATPTISAVTATPPKETAPVDNSKITISANPSELPTKEGDYVLWITKINDSDANDVETFIRIKYSFIPKKFLF